MYPPQPYEILVHDGILISSRKGLASPYSSIPFLRVAKEHVTPFEDTKAFIQLSCLRASLLLFQSPISRNPIPFRANVRGCWSVGTPQNVELTWLRAKRQQKSGGIVRMRGQ
jgi:hypothetical protein